MAKRFKSGRQYVVQNHAAIIAGKLKGPRAAKMPVFHRPLPHHGAQ